MKVKFFFSVIVVILLTVNVVNAQRDKYDNNRNDDSRVVINNYYNDHDYYFSSRINRFHRSYASFGYYSPVFTETYWYSYQPFTWGISIYGGSGFGAGIYFGYPVYGNAYGYGYEWQPYVSSSYYWGYDPFYYYNYRYIPVVYNVKYRAIRSNYYYGWRGRNRWDYGFRPVNNTYNTYNYYSSGRSSAKYSNDSRTTGRSSYPAAKDRSVVDYSRRGVDYSTSTRTETNSNSSIREKSNNGLHAGESRRNTNPAASSDRVTVSSPANNNMHQGAENSRRAAPSGRSDPSGRETTMSQGRDASKTESGGARSGSSSSSSSGKSNRRR